MHHLVATLMLATGGPISAFSVPAEAAAVPDVTGAWLSKGATVPSWHLVASGPGRSHLHATWGGLPGSGHETLQGAFDGTLSGAAYSGDFVITEGTGRVTGTMTFQVVDATHITISLTPAGGTTQTIYLSRAAQHCKHNCVIDANLKINIVYSVSGPLTAPPQDRSHVVPPNKPVAKCPKLLEPAVVSGHIEGTKTDHVGGGGTVNARPLDTLCRVPELDFYVDDITASVSGSTITAVLTVHVYLTASNTQPGQCVVPLTGTITATQNDAVREPNGLTDDTVTFGPWSKSCNAFGQTLTNKYSVYQSKDNVYVWIGCWHPWIPSEGYSPRNCLSD